MPDTYPVPTARPYDDFEQYIPLLLGAVDTELMREDVWEESERADALLYMEDLKSYLMELPLEPEAEGMTTRQAFIIHASAIVEAGAALAREFWANHPMGFTARQNAAAINDRWNHPLTLAAGDYNVDLVYIRGSLSGILSLYSRIDGDETLLGVIDMFNGSTQVNLMASIPFTVPEDGAIELVGKILSKHASSGGYQAGITYLSVRAD